MSAPFFGPSLYAASGQRKYLNTAERARFLAAAAIVAPEVRTFCQVLAFTGCRVSEALQLTVDQVDVAGGVIAIRCLKKRGRLVVREVPVPVELAAYLDQVHAVTARQREHDGDGRRLWAWGRTAGWRVVKSVMRDAAVVSLAASPKGLRHGFGVLAVQSGVPLTLVQRWLGHEDIATTAIYTQLMGPDERAMAARMW